MEIVKSKTIQYLFKSLLTKTDIIKAITRLKTIWVKLNKYCVIR